MYNFLNNENRENEIMIKEEKKKGKKGHKKPVKFIATAAAIGAIAGIGAFGGHYIGISQNTSNEIVQQINQEISAVSTANISSTGSVNSNAIDVSDIVAETLPSVVAVNSVIYSQVNMGNIFGRNPYGGNTITQETDACGTGIIIGESEDNLLVLTNNHVIEDAGKVSVVFVDDREVEGSVLGYDADSDIAVIVIPLANIPEATRAQIKIAVLGDSDNTRVGEAAIAIGNALGYGQSVTTGVVSALNRDVDLVDKTMTLLQTDAAINGGNSGGPLLNANGEVIGINTIKYSKTGVEGMGYAIPINTAKPIIENIINGVQNQQNEEQNVYLGIYGIDLDEQYQRMYGMPEGILVYQTVENSPAAQYGLKSGDIITKIDGKSVITMEELANVLGEHKVGDTIQISILQLSRDEYIESSIDVVLGAAEE